MASASTGAPAYGYAPVRGAYFVHSGSTISAYEPVKLSSSTSEQDTYESLAEIYGILVTLDQLEKSYLRDLVPDGEYTDACSRLLMQYRSFMASPSVRDRVGDLESFKAEWEFDCPRATERIRIGVPATMLDHSIVPADLVAGPNVSSGPSGAHTPASVVNNNGAGHPARNQTPLGDLSTNPSGGIGATDRVNNNSSMSIDNGKAGGSTTSVAGPAGSNALNPTLVVAATENFITLLDAIQMGMMEKDVLHPLLRDLIQSVNTVTAQDFENKGKIVEWLITLNRMRAAERLSEDQSRQFGFDMREVYDGFKATLS